MRLKSCFSFLTKDAADDAVFATKGVEFSSQLARLNAACDQDVVAVFDRRGNTAAIMLSQATPCIRTL